MSAGVLRVQAGRVPIYCMVCRCVVATISEQKLHAAASLTPWRGNSSAILADKITDAATVKCPDCEESQRQHPTPTH